MKPELRIPELSQSDSSPSVQFGQGMFRAHVVLMDPSSGTKVSISESWGSRVGEWGREGSLATTQLTRLKGAGCYGRA